MAFLNDQIDAHVNSTIRAGIHMLDSLTGSPLCILGIIILSVLTFIFAHAYCTAYTVGEPGIEQIVPSLKRLVCVLTITVVGAALMFSFTSQTNSTVRILVAFIGCGILGAAANEMFVWANAADADRNNPVAIPSQSPNGQGTQMNNRESLANALDDLANQIAMAPPVVIGQQIKVTGRPGAGTTIGEQVTVAPDPGSSGITIGKQITVGSGDTPVNSQRAQELRDGARMVREGTATLVAIESLIARSMLPGSNQ
jgi:hypothetical protein